MSADVRRLLGRGGRALGLAALAHARGQRAGAGPWHVLSPELVAAAEELLLVVEQRPEPAVLEVAVTASLGADPCTAAPGWAADLAGDDALLERLAGAVGPEELAPALGLDPPPADPRARALAALAVAFCRNPDSARDLARRFPGPEGTELVGRARLAAACVRPGQPSRVRGLIKRALREEG